MKRWLKALAIATLGLALVAGGACGGGQEEEEGTTQAKNGDAVKVHYTGRLADGTVFDTSSGREPLGFTIGAGKLIPDFEQAVLGMKPGESKTIEIPADRAYPYYDDLVHVMDRDQLPENIPPEVGVQFDLSQPDGQKLQITIIDVSESTVTLDANHYLAGKDLIFDIELVEIL